MEGLPGRISNSPDRTLTGLDKLPVTAYSLTPLSVVVVAGTVLIEPFMYKNNISIGNARFAYKE